MSAGKVTPIRDWWREASERVDRLDETLGSMACDDLVPGYRISAETQVDLSRACRLLDQVQQLLDAADEREDGPYNDYCDQLLARGIEL